MAQHTRFCKDRKLYEAELEFRDDLDAVTDDWLEIWIDDEEIDRISRTADEISQVNAAEYHDVFRTNKREGIPHEYCKEVIFSKRECDWWLEDNAEFVYWPDGEECGRRLLNEFWDKYPNGVIRFG